MRILFRLPTYGRPEKLFQTIDNLQAHLTPDGDWRIDVAIEESDISTNCREVLNRLSSYPRVDWTVRHYGGKNVAYNADLQWIPWDVYVTYADDLEPREKDCDKIIEADMQASFPDTDGCLWYWDALHRHLCSHMIVGRKYFHRYGYLTHPSYRGLWADVEFTEIVKLGGHAKISKRCLFAHQHWKFGKSPLDLTYKRSWDLEEIDHQNYLERKKAGYPLHWARPAGPEPQDMIKPPLQKTTDRPIIVVWHIAQMGPWQSIVREEWQALADSRLSEAASKILINTVAPSGRVHPLPSPPQGAIGCLWMKNACHDLRAFEHATLSKIPEAVSDDALVLYMHTKGVSHPSSKQCAEWRRYMLWACVERWQDCINLLLEDKANVVGAELALVPWKDKVSAPFFAGNFWWATGSYLRTLNPAKLDPRNRWSAEGWVGTGQGCRPLAVHQIGNPTDPNIAQNGILRPGFGRNTYAPVPPHRPNPVPITFVIVHWKMPEKRLLDFLEWNRNGIERIGAKVIIVDDEDHKNLSLPDWAKVVIYPLPMDTFSLSRTSNFGIRQAGEGIVCKTDPDCLFSPEAIDAILGVTAERGVCFQHRMSLSASADDLAKAKIWDASKGTIALAYSHWDAACGYDERMEGYGIEDGDLFYRAGKVGGRRCARVPDPVYHIAHQEGTTQSASGRRDQWNRYAGVNPLNVKANQSVRVEPWASPTWGLIPTEKTLEG